MSAYRIFKAGFDKSYNKHLKVKIYGVSGRVISGVVEKLDSDIFVQVRSDLAITDTRTGEVTIMEGQSEWICVMFDKIESVSLSWS